MSWNFTEIWTDSISFGLVSGTKIAGKPPISYGKTNGFLQFFPLNHPNDHRKYGKMMEHIPMTIDSMGKCWNMSLSPRRRRRRLRFSAFPWWTALPPRRAPRDLRISGVDSEGQVRLVGMGWDKIPGSHDIPWGSLNHSKPKKDLIIFWHNRPIGPIIFWPFM